MIGVEHDRDGVSLKGAILVKAHDQHVHAEDGGEGEDGVEIRESMPKPGDLDKGLFAILWVEVQDTLVNDLLFQT